ncbi:hypothetical protein ATANTOWER_021217 [Ataeniobius toweri]|uniref:Uncharacterized protein n=1 Tax=Ataeniobius toweri TaxID=208326 RepID=A0ABU7BW07_9TELE|nr:hypothetical protein [Ataeniobius toweri]
MQNTQHAAKHPHQHAEQAYGIKKQSQMDAKQPQRLQNSKRNMQNIFIENKKMENNHREMLTTLKGVKHSHKYVKYKQKDAKQPRKEEKIPKDDKIKKENI